MPRTVWVSHLHGRQMLVGPKSTEVKHWRRKINIDSRPEPWEVHGFWVRVVIVQTSFLLRKTFESWIPTFWKPKSQFFSGQFYDNLCFQLHMASIPPIRSLSHPFWQSFHLFFSRGWCHHSNSAQCGLALCSTTDFQPWETTDVSLGVASRGVESEMPTTFLGFVMVVRFFFSQIK